MDPEARGLVVSRPMSNVDTKRDDEYAGHGPSLGHELSIEYDRDFCLQLPIPPRSLRRVPVSLNSGGSGQP